MRYTSSKLPRGGDESGEVGKGDREGEKSKGGFFWRSADDAE